MTAARSFVVRHSVPIYFALVFAISWGLFLIAVGPSAFLGTREISFAELGPIAYLGVIVGPFVAGILAAYLVYGREGLRDLKSRLLMWRVSARWYAVALLTAPLLATAILFVLSFTSPAFLPPIITSADKASLLLFGIAMGLVVPFFEETGWTGFAIPQLRMRHSTVTTGVIVGLLWGAWHYPLFAGAAPSSAAAGISPALYLAVLLFSWLPPYRVLMVWVYDHTKSLLVAMLMHVPIVVDSFVLNPTTGPKVILTFVLVFAAALWVVVAAVALANRRRPRRTLPAP